MEHDDDSWVPLDHPVEVPAQHQQQHTMAEASVPSASGDDTTEASSSGVLELARTTRSRRQADTGDSIQTLQRRVEMRQHLKQRLVHHPIRLIWSHFLWHLGREFWLLDVQVRLALVLIVVGAVAKATCWMTWYLWFPRTIFMSFILMGSWLYLDPNGIPRRVQNFCEGLIALPNRIPETLEQLDPQQARMMCVALLFLPTLLQMRSISFLADINATGGGRMWNGVVTLMLLGVCTFHLSVPRHAKAARDISQRCLLVLYGSALWIALQRFSLFTLPSLVGPFCLSTGTLLLSYDDHDNMEWFSRMIRQALRLTLRDVLTTVGTSVQEDEMLQLAMLRWIVDYWSYTPPQTQGTQNSSGNTTAEATPSISTSSQLGRQELGWDELMPMLNVATDQMSQEVHSLQQPQQASSSGGDSSTPADRSLHNFQAMLASMNVDDRAQPAVAAYRRNVEQFPPTRQLALVVSVTRRCPASLVFLWQLLVASMFQSYSTTFCIFVLLMPFIGLEALRVRAWIRACQSLSRLLAATNPSVSMSDPQTSPPTTTPDDSPTTSRAHNPTVLSDVDPMTILLSGDDDTILTTLTTEAASDGATQGTIPSLLIVWRNVQSSVGALEVSLTAARCVHTGAVAVDFAKNIMSLAKFGVEVSQNGWMHGLLLLVKEVTFQQDRDGNEGGSSTAYTHAAVSAVQNGQRVAHNLRVLAVEDSNTGRVLAPMAGFFGFLGGLFQPRNEGEQNDNGEGKKEGDSTEENENEGRTEEVTEEFETATECHEVNKGPVVVEINESGQVSSRLLKDTTVTDDTSDTETHTEDKLPVTHETNEVSSRLAKNVNATDKVSDVENMNVWEATTASPAQIKDEAVATVDETSVHKAIPTSLPLTASTESAVLVDALEKGYDDNVQVPAGKNELSPAATGPQTKNRESGAKADTTDFDSNADRMDRTCATADADSAGETKGSEAHVPEDLSVVMDLVAEAFEKGLIDESEKNEFFLKLSADTQSDVVSGMKKTLQGLIDESSHLQSDCAAAPVNVMHSGAPTEGGESGSKENPNEDAWSPIMESVASQEEIAVQSLDYSDRLANAVNSAEASLSMPQLAEKEGIATTDAGGIPTVSSSAPNNRRDDEEENMWVKVGGSMAVIGAVVGGAFLAMNQGNQNNRPNENQDNRSSVRIERLDENEEEHWEATGDASRQAQ